MYLISVDHFLPDSIPQVRCLVLSQQAFEKQLGPLSALIDKERIKREDRGGVPMLQVHYSI